MKKKNSIIRKNELEANQFVARVMRVTAILMTLILILNIVGIFIVDMTAMIIAYVSSVILLLLPTLLVNILKKEWAGLKYLFVAISVVFVSILIITLNWHAVVVYIFAIGIASMYFSRSADLEAVIMSIICFAIAQFVAYELGYTQDLNQKDLYYLFVFCIAPRTLSLFAVSFIFTNLSKRTRKLLQNLMDSDVQAKMMKHMNEMQEKSLQVSNSLLGSVNVLSEVTSSTTDLNQDMAEKAQSVTEGSSEMLNRLSEAGENVTNISENLSLLAESTKEISALSSSVYELTVNNDANMKNVIDSMKQINEGTEQASTIIHMLEEQSNEIVTIIDVITKISGQTNLLALNASIESARAGEQGKGFAVVADQIRELADQTRRAVENIRGIIEQVVSNTKEAVDAMDTSKEHVGKGLDAIQVAEESAGRVTEASEAMNDKISSIDSVTSDVAVSSEKIVEAVTHAETISAKNLEEVKNVKRATEQGLDDMTKLNQLVESIQNMSNELNMVVHND